MKAGNADGDYAAVLARLDGVTGLPKWVQVYNGVGNELQIDAVAAFWGGMAVSGHGSKTNFTFPGCTINTPNSEALWVRDARRDTWCSV